MMNCQKSTQLLSESQERHLSLKEKILLKTHVMMCSGCRNFGEQMKSLRELSRAYAKGVNGDALEDKDSGNTDAKPKT